MGIAPQGSRSLRGGSWNNNARNLRAANRNNYAPSNRNNNIGFRVVRVGSLGQHARQPESMPLRSHGARIGSPRAQFPCFLLPEEGWPNIKAPSAGW